MSVPCFGRWGTLKARLIMNLELTFIILARTSDGELATSDIPTLPMIGDVNIFLHGSLGDQDFESEAEIMIAGGSTLLFRVHISVPSLPSPDQS